MKNTKEYLRVALAQVNTIVGGLGHNRDLVLRWTSEALKAEADLVVFPELTMTGYPPEDLLLRPAFIAENKRALDDCAASVGKITVCAGFVDTDREGRLYNALAVLRETRVRAVYRKIELPNYSVFDEKRYFSPGNRPLLLDLAGRLVSISVCEDIWVEEGPTERTCSKYPVDLVVNASASPYFKGKIHDRIGLLKRKSRRNGCAFALCNLVGGQDELIFDGGSLAVSADGSVLCRAGQFVEELLIIDLPVRGRKKKPPSSAYRSGEIVRIGPVTPRSRPVKPRLAKVMGPVEEVYQALVLGTRDYIDKNGFDKVVLGLSGGIDSAVVAAVAVEALGADRVKSVTMPSRFSSEETYNDAVRLAGNLGIGIKVIPIKSVYDAYLAELKDEFKDFPFDKTEENLQARIRGNLLMALSNKYGWIVLTTGNKSEMSVGYSTIYGDMAGGFSVIKDVYKTLVYRLASHINRRAELIPRSIIDRPPTAELRLNQKDQDTLPPYELLDKILELYIEQDWSLREIVKKGFDDEIVCKILRMVDTNEYKRRQAAIGIKITPKAFGRDRRMPVVNRYF